jgi:hypothetical protein
VIVSWRGAEAGTIFLVPHSANWAYDFASNKKAFEVDHTWVDSLQEVNKKALWIKPHFVAPSGALTQEKLCTEPFWAVKKVEESGGPGNMRLNSLTTSGSMATDLSDVSFPELSKTSNPVAAKVWFKSPVLMNTADLKAGDELVWAFGAKKNKRKQAPIKEKVEGQKQAKV